MLRLAVCWVPLLIMGGCATSGKTDYECPATSGGACLSVTEIYARTNNADFVDAPQTLTDGDDNTDAGDAVPAVPAVTVEVVGGPLPTPTIRDPTPIREPARVMRIWVAPWEDKSGNLMVSGYVYTEVETRRWAIGGQSLDAATNPSLHPLQVEQRQPVPPKESSYIDK